jgi:hypothetical protein
MKNLLTTLLIVILVAIIAFLVGRQMGTGGSAQTEFPGAEKHQVALTDAVKYVQNFRKNPQTITTQGGSLNRAIFDKILAQPDCEGIRFYYAQNDNGSPTLVLVGITAKGSDMTKGAIAEMITPCPPFCDESSDLK